MEWRVLLHTGQKVEPIDRFSKPGSPYSFGFHMISRKLSAIHTSHRHTRIYTDSKQEFSAVC